MSIVSRAGSAVMRANTTRRCRLDYTTTASAGLRLPSRSRTGSSTTTPLAEQLLQLDRHVRGLAVDHGADEPAVVGEVEADQPALGERPAEDALVARSTSPSTCSLRPKSCVKKTGSAS